MKALLNRLPPLPAALLGVAAYFLYAKNGITEFSPSLSSSAVIAVWVGVGLCVLGMILCLKSIRFLGYLAYLYALLGFLGSQATYIANIFVSIDGTTFSTGFILTAAAFCLAVLCALVAGILTQNPAQKSKEA